MYFKNYCWLPFLDFFFLFKMYLFILAVLVSVAASGLS